MIDRPGEGEGFAASAGELQALYREAGGDLPTPEIDRRIIAAAHADVRAGARHSAHRANWLKRWLPATSAIAVALLGVSMAWRVVDEGTGVRRDDTAMPERGNAAAPALAPGPRPTTQAASSSPVTAEQRRPAAEAAATRAGKPSAKAVAPPPLPSPASSAAVAAQAPAPLAPSSASRGLDRLDKSAAEQPLVETSGVRLAPREAASARPNALPNAEPESLHGSQRGSLHDRAAEPADGPAWVDKIRALRAAGRTVEADENLARLRARYPAFVLPGDLAGVR